MPEKMPLDADIGKGIRQVTFVRPLQASYLQPLITQYFASNKSEIWS